MSSYRPHTVKFISRLFYLFIVVAIVAYYYYYYSILYIIFNSANSVLLLFLNKFSGNSFRLPDKIASPANNDNFSLLSSFYKSYPVAFFVSLEKC